MKVMTDKQFDNELHKIITKDFNLDVKEPSNLEKIDNLENKGMLDMMVHQFDRFKSANKFMINTKAVWQKWIRR